jgi:hypothetical protein
MLLDIERSLPGPNAQKKRHKLTSSFRITDWMGSRLYLAARVRCTQESSGQPQVRAEPCLGPQNVTYPAYDLRWGRCIGVRWSALRSIVRVDSCALIEHVSAVVLNLTVDAALKVLFDIRVGTTTGGQAEVLGADRQAAKAERASARDL